jgi:capsular exopolysaccharide synthesis family protein
MPQYDVDLRDYWRIVKKRKAIILLMIVLVGASSFAFAKFREPVPLYEAVAAVKIERETNLASILTGNFLLGGQSLDTHAYIITSYPVLNETAKAIGLIPKGLPLAKIQNSTQYMSSLQRLKGMVNAEQEGATNIINVKVVSSDADEATRVANTLVQEYQEYNIREKNRKTFETKAFLEEQLDNTHIQLKSAEDQLRKFKEGYSLVSLDAQTQKTLERLFAVEDELENTIAKRREIDTQAIAITEKQLGSLSATEQFLANPDVNSPIFSLNQQLGSLLIERENLRIDYTDAHPEVSEVNEKIRTVAFELKKELNSYRRELRSQEAKLAEKLRTLKKQTLGLPDKALQLIRLQREVSMQEALYSQLKTKYQETLILESGKVQEVTIVRPALIPGAPFNIPSRGMIVATGLVMGLIIGMVLAFGIEVFDTSMGTIEDVENLLGVPVLGVIPHMASEERKRRRKGKHLPKKRRLDLVAHYDPKSLPAEAFRALRSNLEFIRVDKKLTSCLVTSAFVQEGKTFNVVNLALSMAQAGQRVLLIEADLRKPVIHKMFGIQRVPGLTDYILGNYAWEDIQNNIADVMLGDFEMEDILHTPGLDNLSIVTCGTNPPNPAEILRSERFKDLLNSATKKFDMVFIDAPPVLPVADATEISTLVDGILLVYTVGKIGRGVLKRAKVSLDNVDANVVGVVLNNVKPEAGPDYFKYHTQYYYGSKSDAA